MVSVRFGVAPHAVVLGIAPVTKPSSLLNEKIKCTHTYLFVFLSMNPIQASQSKDAAHCSWHSFGESKKTATQRRLLLNPVMLVQVDVAGVVVVGVDAVVDIVVDGVVGVVAVVDVVVDGVVKVGDAKQSALYNFFSYYIFALKLPDFSFTTMIFFYILPFFRVIFRHHVNPLF